MKSNTNLITNLVTNLMPKIEVDETSESRIDFPRGLDLQKILKLERETDLEDLFSKALTGPLHAILNRPQKRFRARLVSFGYALARKRAIHGTDSSDEVVNQASMILEILHTASLVIDDIEDSSAQRRGAPTVHAEHGLPIALNAGNWLYFFPFRIIEEMQIADSQKRFLSRECQETLLRAHYGQALDVGIPFDSVPQQRVPEISSAAIELKTGALSALAFKMGAIVGGASGEEFTHALETFGKRFGVALQMFDDIGNVTSEKQSLKWAEDIKLKRLTFVTAVAAEHLSPLEYEHFRKIGTLENSTCEEVRAFFVQSGVLARAKEKATQCLKDAVESLNREVGLTVPEYELLKGLQRELMVAYE